MKMLHYVFLNVLIDCEIFWTYSIFTVTSKKKQKKKHCFFITLVSFIKVVSDMCFFFFLSVTLPSKVLMCRPLVATWVFYFFPALLLLEHPLLRGDCVNSCPPYLAMFISAAWRHGIRLELHQGAPKQAAHAVVLLNIQVLWPCRALCKETPGYLWSPKMSSRLQL